MHIPHPTLPSTRRYTSTCPSSLPPLNSPLQLSLGRSGAVPHHTLPPTRSPLKFWSPSFVIGIVLHPATFMITILFTGSKNSYPLRSHHQIYFLMIRSIIAITLIWLEHQARELHVRIYSNHALWPLITKILYKGLARLGL